jgi:hypothetical protein
VPTLTMFLADGAGSAPAGGAGADIAVEAATRFVKEQLRSSAEFGLSDHWAVECVKEVRRAIFSEANQAGAKARDYACTFLGVVSTPGASLLMQIGDGAIVVDIGRGLIVPISPMSGEYANMTNFVTDEEAIDVLAVVELPGRIERCAAFSDGLQRMALNLAANSAHTPFFEPLFAAMCRPNGPHDDLLHGALLEFLSSAAVNERTDDDKSIALAHWLE